MAGLAADKFGGARTIFWGGLVFCIGSLIFPIGSSLSMLLLGRMLVGFGAGMIYLALVKEIDRIYPDTFTSVLGTVILLGYCGSILGGLPLSWAVDPQHGIFSWRWAFVAVAIMTLIGYLAFVFCKSHVKSVPIRREKLSLFPFAVVMRSRNSRILLIAGGVGYAVYYLMLSVLGKKLLEDFCGTSSMVAGGCLSLMVVVSGGMNFLVGSWSTKCGNLRKPFLLITLGFSLLGSVMGLIGLQLNAGTWYFATVLMLIAASAGFSAVTNSLMREYNPPQYTGSGASILNFVAYLAVAVCGNISGILMDKFSFGKAEKVGDAIIYPASSYTAVMILALLIAVAAIMAALALPETHGQNLYRLEKMKRRKAKKA